MNGHIATVTSRLLLFEQIHCFQLNVVILAKPMPQSPRYGMAVAAKKSENIDLLFLLLLSTTAACGVECGIVCGVWRGDVRRKSCDEISFLHYGWWQNSD